MFVHVAQCIGSGILQVGILTPQVRHKKCHMLSTLDADCTQRKNVHAPCAADKRKRRGDTRSAFAQMCDRRDTRFEALDSAK